MFKKQSFKLPDYLVMLILLTGCYLYIPFTIHKLGFINAPFNPEWSIKYLKTASHLSIIPYEKKLCWYDLGTIYYFEEKNGELGIYYLEKSSDAWDENHHFPMSLLVHLYFLRGDYDKVLDIEKNYKGYQNYKKIHSAYVYYLKKDYKKALTYLDEKSKSYNELTLMSIIYKRTGNLKKAKQLHETAEKNLKKMKFKNKQHEKNYRARLLDYNNINSFEEYLGKERKAYGFGD